MNKMEQMLKDISIVDFVLVELMLYLDTHCEDKKALEYYNHYRKLKNQMALEFSKVYFPLTKNLADSEHDWSWGMAPLPWEGACK